MSGSAGRAQRIRSRLRRFPRLVRAAQDFRDRRLGYPLARRYLRGLNGVEIGGSAHNPFYLDTVNVDISADPDTVFKRRELDEVGWALPVDVVAPGDALPFDDKSYDFVLASHVIEHFVDPIRALLEWERVARRYVFLIVPHPDRTFDRGRELTAVDELAARHMEPAATASEGADDRHHSVWTCESFAELCGAMGLPVVETEDPDRKRGNGFAVVIGTDPEARLAHAPRARAPG